MYGSTEAPVTLTPSLTTLTPWATDTFDGHSSVENSFGKMNCFFFVFGALLNTVVCRLIIKGRIRTPVDVCVTLLSVSNWITTLMDLFVGISYINNGKPTAFGSHGFTQFWGFMTTVNLEWFVALMVLLPLSNLAILSKLFIFLVALVLLIFEAIMMAIPMMAMGFKFRYDEKVHMTPYNDVDMNDFPGGFTGYLAWFITTQGLPYLYFYLATMLLLIVNIIRYSQQKKGYGDISLLLQDTMKTGCGDIPPKKIQDTLKKGYGDISPKKVQDTKTCILYSGLYLLLEIPLITLHVVIFVILAGVDSDKLYSAAKNLFWVSMFINTTRASAYPLCYLIARYGTGVVTYPVKKVLELCQNQTNYMRFKDEENVILSNIENHDLLI